MREFVAWYPRTRLIVAGLAVVAMALMIYAEAGGAGAVARPRLWGWALALFLFAGVTFVIDHFSEERARTYAAAIGAEV